MKIFPNFILLILILFNLSACKSANEPMNSKMSNNIFSTDIKHYPLEKLPKRYDLLEDMIPYLDAGEWEIEYYEDVKWGDAEMVFPMIKYKNSHLYFSDFEDTEDYNKAEFNGGIIRDPEIKMLGHFYCGQSKDEFCSLIGEETPINENVVRFGIPNKDIQYLFTFEADVIVKIEADVQCLFYGEIAGCK